MTKVKINKAALMREQLHANKDITWPEVRAVFKKHGATVSQAQFYQVRTAFKSKPDAATSTGKRKATTKRKVVAAKAKAPTTDSTGTAAITFRDNLYQFMTKAQRELGKDTVNAATQSVFDQLG